MRGVWCQALSLPRPPIPWGGQPGFRFRHPCFPGAVGVGVGTQHRPDSVRPCEPSVSAVGVEAEGRPQVGALRRCGLQALSVPRLPVLWTGYRGVLLTCYRRGFAGVGVQHCPFGLHALRGAACHGGGGRPSRGGWPSKVVRSVWCWALSLPWPPVPWGGRPGFRGPCFQGAVGVGVGTQHRSHSVRSCEPSLRVVGVAGGRFQGGALRHCEGCRRSGALPLPAARPLGGLSGSATHVLWARMCQWGGSTTVPLACTPCSGLRAASRWEAVPVGVAFHRCEGRLVSGAFPFPAARPLGRAARVPSKKKCFSNALGYSLVVLEVL